MSSMQSSKSIRYDNIPHKIKEKDMRNSIYIKKKEKNITMVSIKQELPRLKKIQKIKTIVANDH